MEILGIGPLEFLLIVLLALIILGPKDMQKMGKSFGQALNKLVKSDLWRDIRQTSEKVKNLPTELMRDAELDELKKAFNNPLGQEPKIAPPAAARKSLPEVSQSKLDSVTKPTKEAPQSVPPEGTMPPREESPTRPAASDEIPPEEHLHG
jgi:sec-independent protein translocase protein TatB